MAFLDFLFGKGERVKSIPKYTPQQENVLEQLLGQSQQGIPDALNFLFNILGQDEEALKAFEAPALRQFEEQILPTIAERFTGSLGEGSQRSSAFGQQLGKAGAGLAENLAAQRANLSSNALSQLQGLLGMGLSPRSDKIFMQRQPGFLENLGVGLSPGLGALIGGRL